MSLPRRADAHTHGTIAGGRRRLGLGFLVLVAAVTIGAGAAHPVAADRNEGALDSDDLPAAAITAGSYSTCALTADGDARCWGSGSLGQLGQDSADHIGDDTDEVGDALPAIDLGDGRAATSIAAGVSHTCATLDDGAVRCWGFNVSGQLGQGTFESIGAVPGDMAGLADVDLGSGRTATSVTAGRGHTCAVLDDGAVKCWGLNNAGQLGLGDSSTRGDQMNEMGDELPTVSLGTGRTARAITAGDDHTCALLDNGSVKCWGANSFGQLGLGDTSDRGVAAGEMGDNLPTVSLGTGRTARAITAGATHTCALLDDGTVKCWGNDQFGVLGSGTSDRVVGDEPDEMGAALPAVALGAGRVATTVTAGIDHTCALLDDASLKCWGGNSFGQLGIGDTDDRGDEPGEMNALSPIVLPGRVGPAGLTAAMTADRSTAEEGDVITYTVTLRNVGSAALTDLVVTSDAAPACGRTIPTLALAASTSFTCVDTVTLADIPSITSQLTITAAEGVSTSTPAVTITVPVRRAMDLTVSATPESVIASQLITYMVTVTNTGNVPLQDVAFSSRVGTCSVTVGTVAVGKKFRRSCTYTATNADAPSITNRFTLTARAISSKSLSVTTPVTREVIRPDGILSRTDRTVGDGVYGDDGKNQSMPVRLRPANLNTYSWIIENDGNTTQAFTLAGVALKLPSTVRYRDEDRKKITKAVRAGTHRTRVLRPGERTTVTIIVAFDSSVASRKLLLTASADRGPADTVQLKIQ